MWETEQGLLILISFVHEQMPVHVGQGYQIKISFYLLLYSSLWDGPCLTQLLGVGREMIREEDLFNAQINPVR